MKVNNIDIINIFCAIFHTLMMSKINDENWGESFLFFAIVRDPPNWRWKLKIFHFRKPKRHGGKGLTVSEALFLMLQLMDFSSHFRYKKGLGWG